MLQLNPRDLLFPHVIEHAQGWMKIVNRRSVEEVRHKINECNSFPDLDAMEGEVRNLRMVEVKG